MTEQTQWEKDQAKREHLEELIRQDPILGYLSTYSRARLLQFALDTAVPVSALGMLVLGEGELYVTEKSGAEKYALSLIFGGQLTEARRDDDIPF